MKVIHLTIKNRAVAIVLSVLIAGLGVIFLTFGIALLVGLAVAGVLVGTGAAIYRRLWPKANGDAAPRFRTDAPLDPSLEVQPARQATISLPPTPDK